MGQNPSFLLCLAAVFIRMFLIEAYVILTPSMEGSLNVGDYLVVSKAILWNKHTCTVAMIPLLHNTIPGLGTELLLGEKPNLPFQTSRPKNPEHMQFLYRVFVPNSVNVNVKKFAEWGIDRGDVAYVENTIHYFLDSTQVNKIKSMSSEVQVEIYNHLPDPGRLFPFDSVHFWSMDG
ncbi:MAG: S26 family signal peptidase [Saprospiraceae bacterium]|nr:S26 family signal peptidase [Saprospiraceae bacterium]